MSVWVSFDSTALASACYDHRRLQLQVNLRDGARYTYAAVTPALFRDLIGASSKGKFFNQYIRDRFSYAKLVPEN